MTDNEIIKALECCTDESYENCNECPYSTDTLSCERLKLLKDSLDLINTLKAEIKRLKECPKCVYEYDGKVTEYCVQGPCPNFKTVEQIKSEAVKEFAKRLENEIINDTAYACDSTQHSGYYDYQIKIGDIPEYINNLVKEMVSDTEC